ncbi:F0F1 ATP synthase subunit delta [Aquibacillus albus]|uniref:ATP synthase subunit delta n=1 Tax=Aquibacillus albus TaxID=1168171 RepID=A0ABS2MZE8_9BACI|nr:F0F1 ATP synthase subunit delta [Aquibacillus albus]MBM7571288.1 F-type H+-transporting ATPase subunit delta [Aquibacillus albus]
MSKANVSKRYAEALFQIGQEKSTSEQLEAQLQIVKEVFESNKQFVEFLAHPRISSDKKKEMIDQVFQQFSSDVRNTVKILVNRHNQQALPAIVNHFSALVNASNGIADATVYSVRALADEEKQQISNVFSQKLNLKRLNIENIVDTAILGGVKIKIGNTIYDGTIQGKLERIERNIVSAK